MPHWTRETTGDEVVQAFKSRADGKTILITGPTPGGLGAATILALAKNAHPEHILLLARTPSKIQPLISEIHAANPAVKVTPITIDLTSQTSVRAAAGEIIHAVSRIDILILNAAIMAGPFSKTSDGIESQFATNHVSPFLLTGLIHQKLSPGARIVVVSSNGHRLGPVRFEDYNFEDGKEGVYNPWLAYAQSKTANVLFARSLAHRLRGRGISAFSVHPGSILTNLQVHLATPGVLEDALERAAAKGFTREEFKTVEQGSATTLVAALDPELEKFSGAYLTDGQVVEPEDYAKDEQNAERLWELSEDLVGQRIDM